MKINIRPNRQIADVQREFTNMFPFLRLEFFRNGGDLHLRKLDGSRRVAEGQLSIVDGSIDIIPSMTVKELEKKFRDEFAICIQVLRKSDNIWLQTTMTDSWTLQHQNEHGKEISLGIEKNSVLPDEYDLERDADH